jgi:hypothetical protein
MFAEAGVRMIWLPLIFETIPLQRRLDPHSQPIHAVPHVGVTQRQVHLHAGRAHHRAAHRVAESLQPRRVAL